MLIFIAKICGKYAFDYILFNYYFQSPSNSEDESQLRKGKLSVADELAAKLRSKFPGDFTVKRNLSLDKLSAINRARIFERNKNSLKVSKN